MCDIRARLESAAWILFGPGARYARMKAAPGAFRPLGGERWFANHPIAKAAQSVPAILPDRQKTFWIRPRRWLTCARPEHSAGSVNRALSQGTKAPVPSKDQDARMASCDKSLALRPAPAQHRPENRMKESPARRYRFDTARVGRPWLAKELPSSFATTPASSTLAAHAL